MGRRSQQVPRQPGLIVVVLVRLLAAGSGQSATAAAPKRMRAAADVCIGCSEGALWSVSKRSTAASARPRAPPLMPSPA